MARDHRIPQVQKEDQTLEGDPAPKVTTVLLAHGLRKQYGKTVVVDGVSLSLGPGACLALLGPNGAGKTTTVEMLEGLTAPDQGDIHVFGLPLAQCRRQIMQRVGVVLQDTHLYKRYTVGETLHLFAAFYDRRFPLDPLIQKLALGEKKETQLRHLSGGQRQRVALGCALVHDPDLLFLDEPTTGLDPAARHATWDLFMDLKREGKSLLLTTHDMKEAAILADQVAIMDQGRIIAQGSPQDLLQQYNGQSTLEDVYLHLTGRSIRDA